MHYAYPPPPAGVPPLPPSASPMTTHYPPQVMSRMIQQPMIIEENQTTVDRLAEWVTGPYVMNSRMFNLHSLAPSHLSRATVNSRVSSQADINSNCSYDSNVLSHVNASYSTPRDENPEDFVLDLLYHNDVKDIKVAVSTLDVVDALIQRGQMSQYAKFAQGMWNVITRVTPESLEKDEKHQQSLPSLTLFVRYVHVYMRILRSPHKKMVEEFESVIRKNSRDRVADCLITALTHVVTFKDQNWPYFSSLVRFFLHLNPSKESCSKLYRIYELLRQSVIFHAGILKKLQVFVQSLDICEWPTCSFSMFNCSLRIFCLMFENNAHVYEKLIVMDPRLSILQEIFLVFRYCIDAAFVLKDPRVVERLSSQSEAAHLHVDRNRILPLITAMSRLLCVLVSGYPKDFPSRCFIEQKGIELLPFHTLYELEIEISIETPANVIKTLAAISDCESQLVKYDLREAARFILSTLAHYSKQNLKHKEDLMRMEAFKYGLRFLENTIRYNESVQNWFAIKQDNDLPALCSIVNLAYHIGANIRQMKSPIDHPFSSIFERCLVIIRTSTSPNNPYRKVVATILNESEKMNGLYLYALIRDEILDQRSTQWALEMLTTLRRSIILPDVTPTITGPHDTNIAHYLLAFFAITMSQSKVENSSLQALQLTLEITELLFQVPEYKSFIRDRLSNSPDWHPFMPIDTLDEKRLVLLLQFMLLCILNCPEVVDVWRPLISNSNWSATRRSSDPEISRLAEKITSYFTPTSCDYSHLYGYS